MLTCSRERGDTVDRASGALTGPITISGRITDANGLPQSGVRVNLDGTSQAVQTTTSTGTYSFAGLFAGSYSVRPTRTGCSFVPDVVNLNNLSASVVQNFGGSGSACGGTASVNTGATSGAFTISGQVRDASNRAIVGARIALAGGVQALRFTDVAGTYAFRVNAGNYSLAASGACTLTPANVNINNLTGNRVQNFTATTATCATSAALQPNPAGTIFTVAQTGTELGVTAAAIEPRLSNADAIARLQEIGTEVPGTVRSLTIAGLPAIERQGTLDKESERGAGPGPRIWLTTAIATGSTVVRFDSQLPPNASAATINSFFNTARNFTPDALASLHGPARPNIPAAPLTPPATPPPLPTPLFATAHAASWGEIAVAASDTSNDVVYARNPGIFPRGRLSSSQDGGRSISFSRLFVSNTSWVSSGDPSLTVGAPDPALSGKQAFYYSELFATAMTSGGPVMSIVMFRSTDGGGAFDQTALPAIDCAATRTCTVPDQPMIVADKRTRSSQGDRLYVAWRNFNNSWTSTSLACSSDGGNSWSAVDSTSIPTPGDFPRMSVAPDGSLYVVFSAGDDPYDLWVHKYSSCDNGFTKQAGFPIRFSVGNRIFPNMPGLDRSTNGGAYMVAADDSDLTGKRVFVAFINETSLDPAGTGNDDVRLAETTTGGLSWTVFGNPINRVSNGHRFLPWLCATNGIAYVTWYDRRHASNTNTDPTAYFRASFSDQGNTGTPVFGPEVNVSAGNAADPTAFDDPQCLSGFYPAINPLGAPDDASEVTLCTDLPPVPPNRVLAGTCTSCPDKAGVSVCGSAAACDFRESPSQCAAGETCSRQKGVAKYGDYNGAACAKGQLYMSWASAVVPKGINCTVNGDPCSATKPCCEPSTCGTDGFCSEFATTTGGNGSACTSATQCHTLNCFAGICRPGVSVFASSTAVTASTDCQTTTLLDASVNAPFEIDTGPPSMVLGNYGSPACPKQFLVEVDLTQAFAGHDVFLSGRWSQTQPTMPCDELATMTVYVSSNNGATWTTRDIVQYAGMLDGPICHAKAVSHTDPGSNGLDGTNLPASGNFTRARVAITSTQVQGGVEVQIPVLVIGVTN